MAVTSQHLYNTASDKEKEEKNKISENNDNYKCFEYLVTKTDILKLLMKDKNDSVKLVNKCFEYFKPKFVECLIKYNLLKDYTPVLLNVTKQPQWWKFKVLKMLLNDYTCLERNFSIFCTTDDNYLGMCRPCDKHVNTKPKSYWDINVKENDLRYSCLIWCVNIGLGNYTMIGKKNSVEERLDCIATAFDCFKLILECTTYTPGKINKLLNQRTPDHVHIAEVCASNSICNRQFIDYLIDNNGKYDWKIDFTQTNVLQIAAMVGDYKTFEKVVNLHDACNINRFGCTPKEMICFGDDSCAVSDWFAGMKSSQLNRFASLTLYKGKIYQMGPIKQGRSRGMFKNLFYWCANSSREVMGAQYRSIFSDYNGSGVQQLKIDQLKLLCFGYLRNGDGSTHIEYPEPIVTILMKFFDLGYGSVQCFEYLLENYNDENIEINDEIKQNIREPSHSKVINTIDEKLKNNININVFLHS